MTVVSLRYHIVSLSAVFLALALGVVLGSTAISDRLLAGLNSDRAQLQRQVSDLRGENHAVRAQLAEADSFDQAVGPRVVRGVLAGHRVVVITTADAVPADRDALTALLGQAGATVTGQLQLTDAFSDPARADQLSELTARLLPAGVQLPTAADPGTLAGGLLGTLLLVDPRGGGSPPSTAETTAVLAGLGDGGFVRAEGRIQPAQLAVVLTGDGGGNGRAGRAEVMARFAAQLDRAGSGAVLAGRPGAAAGGGPIAVVRADTATTEMLSTIDDTSTAAGRVVTVLALAEQFRGGSGRYGTAGNAQAVVPAIED